jgi:enoyl-CoA hydratase
MNNFISIERKDLGIAILSISRPEALNALNRALLLEMRDKLQEISKDPSVRVLIVRGAGEKSFVAGADIVEMQNLNRTQAAEFSRLGHAVFSLLELMPKVTIAAVHGFALGGGMELTLACDFIMASEKAVFGLPEVSLGVVPGFGGTIRLAQVLGSPMAKQLIFSGARIKAEEAKTMGLIREVLPQDGFFDKVLELATKISSHSIDAVLSAKKLINEFQETTGTSFKIDAEVHQFSGLFEKPDQGEGMRAFVEKRTPKFKGL